jgi:hypothetical protein
MANRKRTKRTNNVLQNTTQKTEDRASRTPLNTRGELRCSVGVGSSCSTKINPLTRIFQVTKEIEGGNVKQGQYIHSIRVNKK